MAVAKPTFWRRCRIYFRRFRIVVWLLVLAALIALYYLNQVGLPDFVKRPLLEELRARGVDLQFSRLRLRWYEGIVAENVRFGQSDQPNGPHLTIGEVQVQFNLAALLRLHTQVDGLVLRQGRLAWPIVGPEQAPRQLSVENIQADLRLLPGDQWALEDIRAKFADANIRLSGTITNALALRDWKFLRASQTNSAVLWQDRMRDLADTLERIHFSAPPELGIVVRGDARDLQSFNVHLALSAPGAETPWGTVSQGRFTARLSPAAPNDLSQVELSLEAADAQTHWTADAQTHWVAATNFLLAIHMAAAAGDTNSIQGKLTLRAARASSEWASADNVQLAAQWTQTLTNPIPLAGQVEFHGDKVEVPDRGTAGQLRFLVHFQPPETNRPPDASWAAWSKLPPYALDWGVHASALKSPKLAIDDLSCAGTWDAPELAITNFEANFRPGRFEARASLDVATRALRASVTSDIDPNRIAPALPEAAQRWLAQFTWNAPPRLQADASLTLPAWTNSQPDWQAEVQPTMVLQGEFNFDHGGMHRGVQLTTAHSHFAYSNLCWDLPDFTATRPDGRIEAEHHMDERSKDFSWRVHSTVDINSLRPALDAEALRALDLFTFTQPPVIDAEIQGCFRSAERLDIRGRVELTNFTFRGESLSSLQTAIHFTNQVLELLRTRVQRGEQLMSADGLAADFSAQKVYLTNGFSTVEPLVIARAIGPQIVRAIEPYRFSQPPAAHVYGVIPMQGDEFADLHFELSGGPFHWWKFNLPRIAGQVHWLGKFVRLTDIRADFYDGAAAGSAHFDFRPKEGPDFQFTATVSNVLLHALIGDLSSETNQLEGLLNGTLTITQGNVAQTNNLEGYGDVSLRDGLIWDIPLFGIFSPVLDGLVPGLGSSRATAGTGTFTITNAVIYTSGLEIDTSPARLLYRGTIDLDGNVNARVEAEFLRDAWVIGPLFRWAFWPVTKMFEYKVTGSLYQPKTEPVYLIPKVVTMPLHPFRTLRDLLPSGLGLNPTNSPPKEH